MKLLISGYYGFGNLGDEAILTALIGALRERFAQAEIVVLSATPSETARRYGVRAIDRWNPFNIQRELQDATAFLSGGGGLIQDQTSRRSACYYLALMAMARRRCPVLVVGQGIGPLRSYLLRSWARRLLQGVEFALVRDELSLRLLRAWGVPEERLLLGGDLALLLWPQGKTLREAPPVARPSVAVCLKGGVSDGIKESIVRQLDGLSEKKSVKIVFMALHPSEDLRDIEEIAARLRRPALVLNPTGATMPAAIECFSQTQAVIGMRLHALIFALLAARPFLALGNGPKIEGFLKQIEGVCQLKIPCLTPAQLETQDMVLTEAIMKLNGAYETIRARLLAAGEALHLKTRGALNAVWERLAHRIEAKDKTP